MKFSMMYKKSSQNPNNPSCSKHNYKVGPYNSPPLVSNIYYHDGTPESQNSYCKAQYSAIYSGLLHNPNSGS